MEAKERYAVAAMALLTSFGVAASALAQTTPNERKASALSAKWRNHANSITYGPDGSVLFVFGQSQPSVVCAPLSLCEIQLQPGETVKDVFVGDTVRWKVDPATSGTGGNQRISIIIKPNDPNLATNMVITTSRRVYHIALRSSLRNYMARVAFSYPDDTPNWNDANNRITQASGGAAVDGSGGVYPEKLNFKYRITGDKPAWRPIRVYNDGTKTYIQFPGFAGGDAPVLYVVSGGFFNSEQKIVNYRLDGDMMVVDLLFDKAVLVSGVGFFGQTKVSIERGG
jgi:type IV secretion system protein VirB9